MGNRIAEQLTVLVDPALDAPTPGGIYVLWMVVGAPISVGFGRFGAGAALPMPAGAYLYVGSAFGGLGHRLLRHATRAEGSPQPVQGKLADHFGRHPPATKRLRWHVDFFLEKTEVELTHVIALHTARRMESDLAGWLMARPETWLPAAGLGASDDKGHTHLLGVASGTALWQDLVRRLLHE